MRWHSVYTSMDYWPALEDETPSVLSTVEQLATALNDGPVGLIFKGGQDVASDLYHEYPITGITPHKETSRDVVEAAIYWYAVKHNIPMIGICRGAQFLCVMNGGSLIQDTDNHRMTDHVIHYGGKTVVGNSDHHQGLILPSNAVLVGESYEASYQHGGTRNPGQVVQLKLPEVEFAYFPETNCFVIQGHPEWVPGTAYENVSLSLINKYVKIPNWV